MRFTNSTQDIQMEIFEEPTSYRISSGGFSISGKSGILRRILGNRYCSCVLSLLFKILLAT